MTFTAAAIQMCSGIDPFKNAATMTDMVTDAARQGAAYVQTPEMTGLMQRDRAALAAILENGGQDPVISAAARLCRNLGIYLHIGSTAARIGAGRMANRAFVFGPSGKLICTYDKIHMFDADPDNGESWRESAVYRPGDRAVIADLPIARVGLAICYDIRFPCLFRAQACAGAEILTAPAAFTKQTGKAHWEILLRARAIENGAFMIAAAQAGIHEDGRETWGHAMIIDPWGRVLADAPKTGRAVILADIDTDMVTATRAKIPSLGNGRDFSLDNHPYPSPAE